MGGPGLMGTSLARRKTRETNQNTIIRSYVSSIQLDFLVFLKKICDKLKLKVIH